MYKIHRLLSAALIAMLALTTAACDSTDGDDDNDQQLGTFNLEISGDAEASFDGFAFFGEAEDPETGDNVFVIYFSESENLGTQAARYAFIGRNAGRPGTGTFSVVALDQGGDDIPEDEFVMIVSLGATPTSAISYLSNGGEISITSSSSNRLEGSFDINATGLQFDGTETQELNVTVEGSFDAIGNDNVFVPFGP